MAFHCAHVSDGGLPQDDCTRRSRLPAARLPELLTTARLFIAIGFAIAGTTNHLSLLFPLAVLIELSDAGDGFVARYRGTATPLGTVCDGLADYFARVTEFIVLAAIGLIGFLPVLVFFWRDTLVVSAQLIASLTGTPLPTGRITGKIKGAAQGMCLLWLAAVATFQLSFGSPGSPTYTALIAVVILTTLISGLDYLAAYRRGVTADGRPRDARSNPLPAFAEGPSAIEDDLREPLVSGRDDN